MSERGLIGALLLLLACVAWLVGHLVVHPSGTPAWLVAVVIVAAVATAGFCLQSIVRLQRRLRAASAFEMRVQRLNTRLRAELQQQRTDSDARLSAAHSDLESLSESVTHDLRNPLNTIGLNVPLLRLAIARDDEELGESAVVHVEQSAVQIAGILAQARRYTQATAAPLRRSAVNLAAVANEVFSELVAAEPAPPVDWHVEALPEVEADAGLVRILLWCLLDNALRCTRSCPRRRISLTASPGERRGPVTYRIADNGVVDDLPFPGESADTGTRSAGTVSHPEVLSALPLSGPRLWSDDPNDRRIGHAIAARVARRHGGALRVDSCSGTGVSIEFSLEADRAK